MPWAEEKRQTVIARKAAPRCTEGQQPNEHQGMLLYRLGVRLCTTAPRRWHQRDPALERLCAPSSPSLSRRKSTSTHSIYPPRLLPTSPPHRVGHVGNLLTVPYVHGTIVPVYYDREKVRSDSQHVSQACAPPDRSLTAAGGVSAVCCYQPCPGTGGAAQDARGLTGLAASALPTLSPTTCGRHSLI